MSIATARNPSRCPKGLWLPLAGTLLVAGAVPAFAAAPQETGAPSVVVKFNDLDLDTRQGAQALYRRLVSAAREVCPAEVESDLHRTAMVRECRDAALARAVRQLNKPILTASIPTRDRERMNL
jgi:UrcA family protein